MLAAMPPTPTTPADPGEPRIRDRGDACPGALRLHAADDGRLARLRVPAGLLTPHQLMVLADAAERLGDGAVSITSRGNVELRGLADGCGAELAGLLRESGLLPSDTHERVRNVVASPLAGLDGLGCGDVQLWARELDALLCANGRAARLSGRFLFALDDGRGDVAGLGADVTLLAEAGGSAVLRVGAAAFRVRAADAARAALAAAEAFLEAASDTGAWRVRELPADREPALGAHLERAGVPAEVRPPDPGVRDTVDAVRAGPLPGIVKGPGGWSLSVAAPLGRLGVAQLRDLLPAPGGEVRLTPWRGVVVPGFGSRDAAGARLGRLADAGFVTDAGSPWYGVGACTGRPGCAKSLADVRADATAGARAGTAARHGGPPVYWSGCERRCGRPHGAYVDVVATADGTYRVTEPFSGTTSTSASASAQTSAAASATDPTDTRAQDRTSTTK
ncbi:cobalamin biosynthesis protein CobG [Streptomyces sp. NPDC006678]|uniref:cobalamin biosynthesis protein CobG n=1 Tax=Streptomyces sp. NPDC006678 TaxID=3157185 RepID=UPI0033ECC900